MFEHVGGSGAINNIGDGQIPFSFSNIMTLTQYVMVYLHALLGSEPLLMLSKPTMDVL